MRLLVAIQCCFPTTQAGLVYVYAWKRFLDAHAHELDCDFVFMNNGLEPGFFEALVTPFRSVTLPRRNGRILWDTDSSFYSFDLHHQGYGYILRVDHDAFLTVENLRAFISFLKANPSVDFVSATNFCRPITNSRDLRDFVLDTGGCAVADIPQWAWSPWRYPTHNSDLYIIKSEFFRHCLEAYSAHPRLRRNLQPYQTPFDTAHLAYREVCQTLGWQETRFPAGYLDLNLRIDGSINTDFWTMLCSLKPVMAGVVNHDGRSFRCKNHLVVYGNARAQGVPFDQLVDEVDIAYPHQLNVVAPYLHTGNGYVSDCFFGGGGVLDHPNTVGQFQAAAPTFAVVHFALLLLLARSSGNTNLMGQLEGTMTHWFHKYGISRMPISSQVKQLYEFLALPLRDYLDPANLERYAKVLE